VVIAHETGHKFGLTHYREDLDRASAVPTPNPPLTLTQLEYALIQNPPQLDQTYGRYLTYSGITAWPGIWSYDAFVQDFGVTLNNTLVLPTPPSNIMGPLPLSKYANSPFGWTPPSTVLLHTWKNPITPGVQLGIWRAYPYLMSWFPVPGQLMLVSQANWRFRPPSGSPPFPGDYLLMCGVNCHGLEQAP
jgi:hypothetical protein